MMVFLDTEFTDFIHPELLSLGLVAMDGLEHYVELDLTSEIGLARVEASSDFVRYDGILDLWGRVPGATVTYREMGLRSGEWLLQMAQGARLEVAFDYATDYELMEEALRDCDLWEQVREVVQPVDVRSAVSRPHPERASQACYDALAPRGIGRHHALADALALRAAFMAFRQQWAGGAP